MGILRGFKSGFWIGKLWFIGEGCN
jgi:hypothetical protein